MEIKYEEYFEFDIEQKLKSKPGGVSEAEYESSLKTAMNKSKYFILDIYGVESDFYETFVVDNSQPNEKSAVNIGFSTDTEENHKYKNIQTKEYLEESSLNNKKYLIKDTLQNFFWKLEKEEKMVCELPARKASFFNDKDSILIQRGMSQT